MATDHMGDATITTMATIEMTATCLIKDHEETTTWEWVEVQVLAHETITITIDSKTGCNRPHKHLSVEITEIAETIETTETIEIAEITGILEDIPNSSHQVTTKIPAQTITKTKTRPTDPVVVPLQHSRTKSSGSEKLVVLLRTKKSSESVSRDSDLLKRQSTNSNQICQATQQAQVLLTKNQLTRKSNGADTGLVASSQTKSASTSTQQSSASSSPSVHTETNVCICTQKLNVNLARTAHA